MSERLDGSRRDAMLDAAGAMLSQVGYDALSMRLLAERIGVSKATVFHHFASKAELAIEALARHRGAMVGALASQCERGAAYAALVDAFAGYADRGVMCPAGAVCVGGAPDEVRAQAEGLFGDLTVWMTDVLGGGDEAAAKAKRRVALVHGALLLSVGLRDRDAYRAALGGM